MDLVKIKSLAYELMGNKSSHDWKEKGNKYYHGERVSKLVLKLRKYILPNDDSHDDILTAAALFHDIMNGDENHGEEGAKRTREILSEHCTEYELDEICSIINVHDDRSSDHILFSDYIKLHQDADHLDHFGTYDVWMEFLYAIKHDMTITDVIDWFQNTRRNKDKQYKEELNFKISKKILDEKCEFVHYFGDRLSVEGIGGIWNEIKIMND